MRKRSLFIALLMIFVLGAMAPGMSAAATTGEDGEVIEVGADEETYEDTNEGVSAIADDQTQPELPPTAITDAKDLLALAEYVNSYGTPANSDGSLITYTLEGSIDMATYCKDNGKSWPGIGTSTHPFQSNTFNGNGYTVTLPGGGTGLFGVVMDATIENVVILSNGTLTTTSGNVGAVVSNFISGTIRNCGNFAAVNGGYTKAGGIAVVTAEKANVTIENCFNAGNIQGEVVGGIVGNNSSSSVSVINCYNTGEIVVQSEETVEGTGGGIMAYVSESLSNCYNAGSVTKNHDGSAVLGAIAGEGSTYITSDSNCYSFAELQRNPIKLGGENSFGDQFLGSENWDYSTGFYPQLTCFSNSSSATAKAASKVSAAAAFGDEQIADMVKLSPDGTWSKGGDPIQFGQGSEIKNSDSLRYIIIADGITFMKEVSLASATDTVLKLVAGEKKEYKDVTMEIPYAGAMKTITILPDDSVANLEWHYQKDALSSWEKVEGSIAIAFEDYGVTAAKNGAGLRFSGIGTHVVDGKAGLVNLCAINTENGMYWSFLVELQPTLGKLQFTVKVDGMDYRESDGFHITGYDGDAPAFTWQGKVGETEVSPEKYKDLLNVVYYKTSTNGEIELSTGSSTAPMDAGSYALGLEIEGTENNKCFIPNNFYYKFRIHEKSISELKTEELSAVLSEVMLYENPDADRFVYKNFELYDSQRGEYLKPKTDNQAGEYTVEYLQNEVSRQGVNTLGEWTIAITGIGNYIGTISETFEVRAGEATISLVKGVEYGLGRDSKEQWTVDGASKIKYSGGVQFFVKEDKDYTFEKVK